MKKYVKDIVDNKCLKVFSGQDLVYARSVGYEEREVEQGYDGNWYLLGFVPVKSLEEKRAETLSQFLTDNANYRQNGTVEYDGKFFSISNDAKINVMAQLTMSKEKNESVYYFQKNGSVKVYTPEEFSPLAIAIGDAIALAEAEYYTVLGAIENASSEEDLAKIKWNK